MTCRGASGSGGGGVGAGQLRRGRRRRCGRARAAAGGGEQAVERRAGPQRRRCPAETVTWPACSSWAIEALAARARAARSVPGMTTATSSAPVRPDDVAAAHELAQALGDGGQRLVAGVAAAAVVERAEAVDVDEHEGERLLGLRGAGPSTASASLAEGVAGEHAAAGSMPGAIDELGLQRGDAGAGVVERPAQIVAVPRTRARAPIGADGACRRQGLDGCERVDARVRGKASGRARRMPRRWCVLGIDPGLANTGYGVVAARRSAASPLDGGVISTPAGVPAGAAPGQSARGSVRAARRAPRPTPSPSRTSTSAQTPLSLRGRAGARRRAARRRPAAASRARRYTPQQVKRRCAAAAARPRTRSRRWSARCSALPDAPPARPRHRRARRRRLPRQPRAAGRGGGSR